MGEARYIVLASLDIEEADEVLSLIQDAHESGAADATRLSWWIGTRSEPKTRLTVLEAIEAWTAIFVEHHTMLANIRRGGETPTEQDIEDVCVDARGSVVNHSFEALVWGNVPVYPDLGSAARPFWTELVEAAAKYPEAFVFAAHEANLIADHRRKRR